MGHEKHKGRANSLALLVLLIASLGLFALTLRYVPFSAGYVLCVVLIGVITSFIMLLYWKNSSPFLYLLNTAILIAGMEAAEFFFHNESGWMLSLQYIAIVLVVSLSLWLLFRKRFSDVYLRHIGDA